MCQKFTLHQPPFWEPIVNLVVAENFRVILGAPYQLRFYSVFQKWTQLVYSCSDSCLSFLKVFLADLTRLIYARRSLLQLIYARPCNWLVIPWPQLGYSSISILCHALLYNLCYTTLFFLYYNFYNARSYLLSVSSATHLNSFDIVNYPL